MAKNLQRQKSLGNPFGDSSFGTAAAVVVNVFAGVGIVVLNKEVFTGLDLPFPVSLLALHYAFSYAVFAVCAFCGLIEMKHMPWRDVAIMTLAFVFTNGFLNLSLMLNSVGFYQASKLTVTPVTVAAAWVCSGDTTTLPTVGALALLLVGLGVATVSDVLVTPLGLAVAAVAVVAQVTQGLVGQRILQRDNIDAMQLVLVVGLPCALIFGVFGPLMDYAVTGRFSFVEMWHASPLAILSLFGTCVLAALCNWISMLIIKVTSAVSYQVVGHLKNVLVMTSGFVLFGSPVVFINVAGLSMSVCGGALYSHLKLKPKPPAAKGEGAGARDTDEECGTGEASK